MPHMPHISRGVAAATLAFSAYGARSVSRHGLRPSNPTIASQTYLPQFHKQVLSFVCSVVGSFFFLDSLAGVCPSSSSAELFPPAGFLSVVELR